LNVIKARETRRLSQEFFVVRLCSCWIGRLMVQWICA